MEFDSDQLDEECCEEFCNVMDEDLPENDDFSDEDCDTLDNAAKLGLALGFGDFISNERLKDFPDLSEQIRKESLSTPITFAPIYSYKKEKKLRPFEKFVDDLCKGRISIDDEDY